jgi:hypothetical protein
LELGPDVDPDALNALLNDVQQGDVLDVAKSVRLYSPDVPSYPREVHGVPHEEPVMTMETQLPSGLCVIISQNCDLRRTLNLEPYVIVAPLTEAEPKTYREAADGLTSRFFAYPRIDGHEDKERLVVDMRVLSSLEKSALLSSQIERIPCPLSGPRQEQLREFLGERFGRPPFPDEIVRQVIEPIEAALARLHPKEHLARVFASLVFIGLSWTPGKSYCSLMLLADPSQRERYKVDDDDVDTFLKQLRKQLTHFTRTGDYRVTANLHDVTEVAATEVLSHEEITFEIDAVDLEEIAAREAEARAAS